MQSAITEKSHAIPQRCGAKKRNGKPCQAWGMENGRCRMHGGKAGRPVKTGRYSLKHRASLAAKQAEFLSDPSPGDLTDELALMRALLQDYLERYADGTSLPAQEIDRIFGMIREISQLVERVSKILNSTALTQADMQLLKAILVDEFTSEPDRLERMLERMGQISR